MRGTGPHYTSAKVKPTSGREINQEFGISRYIVIYISKSEQATIFYIL